MNGREKKEKNAGEKCNSSFLQNENGKRNHDQNLLATRSALTPRTNIAVEKAASMYPGGAERADLLPRKLPIVFFFPPCVSVK